LRGLENKKYNFRQIYLELSFFVYSLLFARKEEIPIEATKQQLCKIILFSKNSQSIKVVKSDQEKIGYVRLS
jgi:hypothetical protein